MKQNTCAIQDFAAALTQSAAFTGSVTLSEPLAPKTTMRVGGEAALFLAPASIESLVYAVSALKAAGIRFFVLGGGSNVVISDKGFPGAVITTTALNSVELCTAAESASGAPEASLADDSRVLLCAQAGARWGRVVTLCKQSGLLGFEAFAGLPGTVGGALYMNSSCFGFSSCDALVAARYLDVDSGAVCNYTPVPAEWGYKRSPFQTSGKILLDATFCVRQPDADMSAAEIAGCYEKALHERASKGHFSSPSAGSTFKNIPAQGIVAGKLIDECGLKGYSVGGAQIAPWHGNFVINAGGATADDIKELVRFIIQTVKAQKGVVLEPEILFVE